MPLSLEVRLCGSRNEGKGEVGGFTHEAAIVLGCRKLLITYLLHKMALIALILPCRGSIFGTIVVCVCILSLGSVSNSY